ncbi:MAG: uroporphyrinogen-III synthase [Caldimonas sp.]
MISTTASPRVVVTRPAAQAAEWVARLQAQGIDAEPLPLIAIVAATDAGALDRAWASLPSQRLVIFVSANAVDGFFSARPDATGWPKATIAAAPGPGTSAALRRAGVDTGVIVEPAADAMQFDSESLWLQLAAWQWAGASALIVRGDGGRDWLGERLREAGARVETVDAYRRAVPCLAPPLRRTLDTLAHDVDAIWLFSSSQSIDHLEQLAAGASWAGSRAIATHPRIVERARAAGFGVVRPCGASLAAVVACIQSFDRE